MTNYIQQARLNQCQHRDELPVLSPSILAWVGDRMGFFQAFQTLGSLTCDELAEVTCADERYVTEWLTMAERSGHISFLPRFQRYVLPKCVEAASVVSQARVVTTV